MCHARSALGPDHSRRLFLWKCGGQRTGLLVTILATKGRFEVGSADGNLPPHHYLAATRKALEQHSLSIFLAVPGLGWLLLFLKLNPEGKWGQVVGNVVSEMYTAVLDGHANKELVERGSKETATNPDWAIRSSGEDRFNWP